MAEKRAFPKRKIAFIAMGPPPYPNVIVGEMLGKVFSEFEVEVIRVREIVEARKDVVLINLLFVLMEHGLNILMGRQTVRQSFITTTYIFKQIGKLVAGRISKGGYVFSFAMQSLFDASVPGLPHFLYTDHTHLANLGYPHFDRRTLRSDKWISLERAMYHKAALNFVRSTNIAASLIEDYDCPRERVVLVGVGSNAKVIDGEPNNDGYGNKNILFVGVDWEGKGGPELVEAFKAVLEVQPDAQLTIVGCSPKIEVPNCHIVGRVPLEEVSQYYTNASVFCLPTKREPFGVVIVEAMHHKLPIVSTRIGAIPDLVVPDKNGYLVEPGDVENLTKALLDLIGDPVKCKRFGGEGYRKVVEDYNWDEVALRMKAHISRVIGLPDA